MATTITNAGVNASDTSIGMLATVCTEALMPRRSLPATIRPYDNCRRIIAKITTLRYGYSASRRHKIHPTAVFKFLLSTEERETEWLKRVGTPARLELGLAEGNAGMSLMVETVKAMKPGGDLAVMIYFDREGAVLLVTRD